MLVQPGRGSARAREGNQVLGNRIPGEDLSLSHPPELLRGVREGARGGGGQRRRGERAVSCPRVGCGGDRETQLSWCSSLPPAPESPERWLRGLALTYEELSCKRGWMAQGLIKPIDLLLPAPSLAAREDLMDGSCPGAQCAGGLVIKHALEGVDKAGGDRQQAGINGEKRDGGVCCWYPCRCP